MKNIKRLSEDDLNRIVKKVINEQSDDKVSPQDLITLSKDILAKIGEIERLVETEKSKLKYKLKNFFRKIIKSTHKFGFVWYFRQIFMDTDPISSLINHYDQIVKSYNNGRSRVNLNEIGYENMVSLYNELNVFKRRLDALEILIRSGIIDDYSDLSA